MNYKKLYNIVKTLGKSANNTGQAYNYGKERAVELLSKGYSQEQAQNIIQKELLARYGLSEIGKEIATGACIEAGSAIGQSIGTMIEPGAGTLAGGLVGAGAGKLGCDRAIEYFTDKSIKNISEKVVKPANPPKKQELKDKEMYFESLDPHIEAQPARYFMEMPYDTPSIDTDSDGVFHIRIEENVPASKYKGYLNPLNNDSRIFTREDIGDFSTQEYADAEPMILAQWGEIGIPTNGDLEHERLTNNGTVFVNGYTRSDGTKVKSYYRAA